MKLRHIEHDDIIWMWECRNEIGSRNNSIHTDEVTLSEHIDWVNQSRLMNNRKLMIAYDKDQKIAVVRLDREDYEGTVSINVAKEHRGKGNSSIILKELEVAALEWDKRIHTLKAVIKKGNNASIKTFSRAGYVQCYIENELVVMKKKVII
ncbi:RimJ/RimL family protein N-acetyltransferase [Paenibacillus anaericanus]|uniref:GNAT family N-acetyltransferase n=1 Tax=Paenibacillus anaericanus TaxID=170367 RepID=UPI002789BF0E|nr:GNAT family N-acetyltransferase [Paenibacillus anaericanus]MDQ0089899.1 RimJ/RimL family protein N-acetyltransferase [Paenibacillus anaericanus]